MYLLVQSAYGKFKLFVQDLLRQIVANVGWDSDVKDDHLQSLLRSLVVPKLGIYGDRVILLLTSFAAVQSITFRRVSLPLFFKLLVVEQFCAIDNNCHQHLIDK